MTLDKVLSYFGQHLGEKIFQKGVDKPLKECYNKEKQKRGVKHDKNIFEWICTLQ